MEQALGGQHLTEVVAQELVTRDVTGVNTWDLVVHQKVNIKLRNARGLGDCTESLPQVIPPFR
jgi:hypothetical protein